MDRVVVFIDYQNVHGWARRNFVGERAHPAQGHISPLLLGELLTKRRQRPSELQEVRVYRGRPNPGRQQGAARANDRQTAAWQRSQRVTVIRRNLMYPPQYPNLPATEKGIDVAIAVDMIRLAMVGDMDAAILFSSDKDLLPAVETLWDHPSTHVEVAAWTKAPRLRISGTQLPWCHTLSRADFDHVHDPFDYSAPV
ncbi:hypothetical protein MAHJHV65_46010 [Mycobacterium avium subsp. hominissuis]